MSRRKSGERERRGGGEGGWVEVRGGGWSKVEKSDFLNSLSYFTPPFLSRIPSQSTQLYSSGKQALIGLNSSSISLSFLTPSQASERLPVPLTCVGLCSLCVVRGVCVSVWCVVSVCVCVWCMCFLPLQHLHLKVYKEAVVK